MKNFNSFFNSLVAMPKRLAMVLTVLFTLGVGNAWAETVIFLPNEFSSVTSSNYSLTKGNITVSVTTSTVNNEQFRIFKNQTLTISAANGDQITGVEFTCTASGTTKYGPGCFGSQTGYSYSGTVGTWTGNASSVSFKATSDQVRATEIVVTYGSSCDKIVTVQAGKPIQGASFQLDKTGEQECCDDLTVTVSDIVTPSGYQFSAITQTGINSGVTIDQTNKIVTYAQNTSGTSTINVTFTALVTHSVSWMVNGIEYTEGNPTASVYEGAKWSSLTLPTAPNPNDYCGQVFAGWTTTNIGSTGLDKDNDATAIQNLNLMTSENKSSKTNTITEPTTFYAVFADYAD
jgi:hypothetical protein